MLCQKCRAPLRLDTSLEDLSPAALKLLIEASSSTRIAPEHGPDQSRVAYTSEEKDRYEAAARLSPGPMVKRTITADRDRASSSATDAASMSFVMLTDSHMADSHATDGKHGSPRSNGTKHDSLRSGGSLAQRMETTARLFEVLSSRSDIDHPICVECTDILLDGMEKRLADVAKERDVYAEYLKNANAHLPTNEEVQQAEQEIEAVRRQEEAALAELEGLEEEKARLEEELAAVDLEARELEEEEKEFWRERNALTQQLDEYQQERDSLQIRHDHDARQLEKLQKTNVWSDTFNIQYDGDGFGTINGLRLGRKSGRMVEWAEVNAAWGQALLLLVVVAEKLKYTFRGYRPKPLGSTSTIEKLESASPTPSRDAKQPAASLQLFYTSDLPLSIGFLHRHFDAAMIAFLECLRQLGAHLERTDTTVSSKSLPYEIRRDKINDISIKLGNFNGDENWTKACKLTLICCKFVLAHASIADLARRDQGTG